MDKAVQNIQMVDLKTQYQAIKREIDAEVMEVVESCAYINGPKVKTFQKALETYLKVKHVIPCANGTDALQIALMALGLKPGDEVIVPAFTYVATAEVISLLQLKPIMVDVDKSTFNVTADIIKAAITPNTKAIVPVNLYGQSVDLEPIVQLAKEKGIYVVEDNAQAIGAEYTFKNGGKAKTGTIGDIGCTSFYPSKNLGCYGDGGAIFTNNDDLAFQCKTIANHGQSKRYYHDVVGVNSRLDSIQAAVLNVKLKKLDEYSAKRNKAANYYDKALADVAQLQLPVRQANSTHVFHQYTMIVKEGSRDELQVYLKEKGIPSMIYYPVPLYEQKAFAAYTNVKHLENTDYLCARVISLPMHSELEEDALAYITQSVIEFFE